MPSSPSSENPLHVVVVGAGFGGLRLVRELRTAPVRITLVDRRNYHLFQPLLYQVATAGLGPTDIAKSVREILRGQRNVSFRLATVTGVDFGSRQIETTTGSIPYDHLVLAVGGQTNFFGNAVLAEQAFGLKDLDDAVRIRNHILSAFEFAVQEANPDARRAMLTFVVVGGGPTGVECAGALSELIRLVLVNDYPELNIKDVRIVLLEASDRMLPTFPEKLRERTAKILWSKFVEVRFGARVEAFNGRSITLKGGENIPAHTMIWAAGARASRLMDQLGLPQDRLGRVKVDATQQVPGHPEICVVGDAACADVGEKGALPMVAPVAIQQATCVAQNIVRGLAGKPAAPFHYRDPGQLATIGRNKAVAGFGRLQFTGFFAWILWLVVHILFLIGFRNRLVVLINWAWDYFFYNRAVRLITHDEKWTWQDLPGKS
jgi:NADH:ubiquinone reductase (H+-translocating)